MKWLLSPIKYVFNAAKTLVEIWQLESDYLDWMESEHRRIARERAEKFKE